MTMGERFVSEVISPVVSTCDTSRMAIGEPGLPREFLWRDRTSGLLRFCGRGGKPGSAVMAAPNGMSANTGSR